MKFFAGVESVLVLLTTHLLLFVYLFSKLSVSSFLSGACSPRQEGKACSSAQQQQRQECRQEFSPKTLRRSQDDHTHLKINTDICTGLCELNHCWMPDLPRVLPRDGAAVCQGAALLPAALGEV